MRRKLRALYAMRPTTWLSGAFALRPVIRVAWPQARGRSVPRSRDLAAASPNGRSAPRTPAASGRANGKPHRPTVLPAGTAHAWRTQLVDVPYASRLLGVGARAHLVRNPGLESSPGTLYVELRLFAQGLCGCWWTESLEGGPFSVAADDLERSVQEIVMPARLEVLAGTLRAQGIDLLPGELQVLPFMLEISPELEGELVQRRLGRVTV